MDVKKHLRYLFFVVLVLFVLNKLLIRPWVLDVNLGFPSLLIVNSFPNFAEAVVGTLVVTNLILLLRLKVRALSLRLSNCRVCLLASLISGFYVISQELEIHNIGGNNVYDPNDIAASIIGLIFINIIFARYGVAVQHVTATEEDGL